ncbi:MAG: hypothetical protein SV487_09845 [Thermodesulfobacteriota bacterium]|nr:hypothetical protein [Thermodesulfobacteriota bacterium]
MPNHIETIRSGFRPDPVNILYVGESAPAGGNFFYCANSALYSCIQSAFENVYDGECGVGETFLNFFKDKKCYLDDLCLEPVNNLADETRQERRRNGIPALAARIEEIQPKAIVVVMIGIDREVKEAVNRAGLTELTENNSFYHTAAFPAYHHGQTCVENHIEVLQKLIGAGILTR